MVVESFQHLGGLGFNSQDRKKKERRDCWDEGVAQWAEHVLTMQCVGPCFHP